ncbi:FecR family protein [Thalassotalea hakodatensis]|uniref:FecR family protein n=1 Tax=Thalassotalea hakodatensis TaxID=3030492 RepID=UPI002573037E|nr:FecR domain-containing protein [Thalassotalea hakodatensis]
MANHSVHDPIRLQASAWISRLNRGLTDEEKPQLIAWINQNPKHHKAIYKCASFFDNIAHLEELNGVFPLEENPRIWTTNVIISTAILLAIAISLTVASFYWIKKLNNTPSTRFYATNIGESHQYTLPDGSKVLLNSNSKVSVNYTETSRVVNLIYGEGQFNVEKNADKPFIVIVGRKSFTALGTIFNVEKSNEMDMELIVTEGVVLISDSTLDHAQLKQRINHEQQKTHSRDIITAHEKASIENSRNQHVATLSMPQLSKALAWQQGMLIFDSQPLMEVLQEVSRYTDIQFEILSSDIANIEISGTYNTGDVKKLLASLAHNFNIQYKYNATNTVQLSLK